MDTDKHHASQSHLHMFHSQLTSSKQRVVKGKGTQKYKWILSESIWKTTNFYANCMKIGFLFFKILQFYIFKTAANGGRHFEINIKTENY